METKVGALIELKDGKKFLVDDIQMVEGKEYLVLYMIEENAFFIAVEKVLDGKIVYEFLGKEEALKIASAIDKNRN